MEQELKNKICENCLFWIAYQSRTEFGICHNSSSPTKNTETYKESYCKEFFDKKYKYD